MKKLFTTLVLLAIIIYSAKAQSGNGGIGNEAPRGKQRGILKQN
jgi:hypothetical protein